MKKVTLLILFLSTLLGQSQVKSYNFSSTIGDYSEIAGGTLLGDESNDGQYFVNPLDTTKGSGVSGDGFPIGFGFVYNGFTYNRFGVNVDGWIALGTSTSTPSVNASISNGTVPMNSTYGIIPEALATSISALSGNLQAQGGASLRFELQGSTPNRVLVVQWKNYRKWVSTGDSFDFQIRLYETSNKIEFVYGTMVSNEVTTKFNVGLRAEPSTIVSNFTNRTSTTSWDSTVAGTLATDGISMNNILKPTKGLTYSWTPNTVCGSPKNMVASALTDTGATISWENYIPQPSSYEYVVTTSAVLPTGSGTPVNNSTANISSLQSNTKYNVYLRSSCGAGFSKWDLYGSFMTKCSAATTFTENFDSYTPSGESVMPYCWERGGAGTTFINTGSGLPGTAPNSLFMNATGSAPVTMAYAVLPAVTNLNAETHRLKFKAFAAVPNGKLDIGYYTDSNNVNTFVRLKTIDLPSGIASSALEFVYEPKSIPVGVKCLGLRNQGISTGYAVVRIDDVVWEAIPPCPDVKNIVVNVLSTSAKVEWTSGGTETAWQYYAKVATDANPPNYVNVTTTTATVTDLIPSTPYKVWVRSKCADDTFGTWIGPVEFTTSCAQVTEFVQNFDASASLPACWNRVGSGYALPSPISGAPSGSRVLKMIGSSNNGTTVFAMQPVSNAGAGTHRLKFKFRSDDQVGAVIEVGYLTDVNDAGSFVFQKSYAASSTTAFDNIVVNLGSVPTTPYLAFRVLDNPSSTILIDDVVWEQSPACPDVLDLALKSFTGDSVILKWTTSGTGEKWQYAIGTSSTLNPSDIKDFTSNISENGTVALGTISDLSPSTAYKVWIRSKCGSSFGAWADPLTFTTTCASLAEFTQNFDASTAFPTCWAKMGTGGFAWVTGLGGASAPNVLSITSDNPNSRGVVVMQPVSNSAAGSHRLRFKFRGSVPDAIIEVGYFNMAVKNSFVALKSITSKSTTEFTEAVAVLGFEPATQVLAFRNPGVPGGTIYIDNVTWEAIPDCPNITDLKANFVTNNSVDLSWTAGDVEDRWQYVVAPSTVSDPNTLPTTSLINTDLKDLTIDGLTPNTSYKIWVRSNCGSENFGVWVDPLVITTNCTPVATFTQNFDAEAALPACWKGISANGVIAVSASEGPSSPNVLTIGNALTSKGTVAMQPVSNINAGTHRLRFKFRSSIADSELQVGYLPNPSDPNSFVLFEAFTENSTTEYQTKKSLIAPEPNMQVLAFRNVTELNSTIYIDDVSWEPIPTCPDIDAVTVSGIKSNSTGLSWTTDGTAKAWQYAVKVATDASPLTPVNASEATATAIDLIPATNYKVWVRSKCGDDSFGAWSSPSTFTTNCAPVTTFTQNFDDNTAVPECWKQVGTSGSVAVSKVTGASSPNALVLNNNAVVAAPIVSNASAGTHRLKFKFASSVANGVLEVGYVTDINQPSTFEALELFESGSSTFKAIQAFLETTAPQGSILAFRNAGAEGNIYIDDVAWEPKVSCTDVVDVKVKLSENNSVQLSWAVTGTEKAWQYAVASSTVTNPDALPLASKIDTDSKNVTVALTPNTSYKIWVRSNCGNGDFGAWTASTVFLTSCPAVQTITENFDTDTNLPNCWNKISTSGSMAVVDAMNVNALELKSQASNNAVYATIPALSSAVTGGYKMKFKYKSNYANTKIEVICYKDLVNLSGTNSYTVLKSINVSAADTEYTFNEILPAAETPQLGFRVYNTDNTATVYIDDFAWQLPEATTCATGIAAAPYANCGNFETAISWDNDPNATTYKLTIGTTSGGSEIMNNQDIGNVLSYSYKGNANTIYYYTVKPFNSVGGPTECEVQSFKTAANNCYCTSTPYSKDGSGVAKVAVGTSDFDNPSVAYVNHSDKIIDLMQGANSNLSISFNTEAYGYYSNVWIDFNDNYEFEPTELVSTGKAADPSPAVLDASFMMSATAPLGTHGMRISATRAQQIPADPCYSGLNGITLDFKVNIAPYVLGLNDFDEVNFSYYPNPVRDMLNLSFTQEMGDVSVVNLLGQQVIFTSLNSKEGKIDMSGLSSGAYLIRVTAGSQTKTIKVIKE